MRHSIFLLGFMGSGKSHWGRRLSEQFQLPFYDLDTYIIARSGRSIPAIFAESGEAGFRELERSCLHELLAQGSCIVATGGGTPCFFDNLEQMNRLGRTVYLQVPVEILAERLSGEMQQRPLIKDVDPAQLPVFIENLLEKRAPFYEKAQHIPEWSGLEALYFDRLVQAAGLKNT